MATDKRQFTMRMQPENFEIPTASNLSPATVVNNNLGGTNLIAIGGNNYTTDKT